MWTKERPSTSLNTANSKFTSSSGKPPSWDTKLSKRLQHKGEFLRRRRAWLSCAGHPGSEGLRRRRRRARSQRAAEGVARDGLLGESRPSGYPCECHRRQHLHYSRVAKNNQSTLFDTVSVIESNSFMAGYFRLNWSNLCTHLQIPDCAGVKLVRASRLAS